MTDDAALDEEDRVLGDRGDDVGEALDALRDREELDRGARLLDLLRDPLAAPDHDLAVEVVDVGVRAPDLEAQLDVAVRERHEHVAHHLRRALGHLDERGGVAVVAGLDEARHALRDPLAHVRDALELVGHPHRGQDHAEVARHRASEREKPHALRLELELHRVDLGVARADSAREVGVALPDDLDHPVHALLDEPAEREEVASQVEDSGREVHGHGPILTRLHKRPRSHHPKRPVT